MKDIVSHVVRRGVNAYREQQHSPDAVDYHIPRWGVLVLGATVLLFCGLDFMIEYTYGRVVPTLLMIESPETILFEPIKSDCDPDTDTKVDSSDLLLVKAPLITSSFRSTISHLRAKAGPLSRFRGLSLHFISHLSLQLFTTLLSILISHQINSIIAPFLATILCAPLYLAWTHVVISEASPLPWYKRFASIASVKKILLPTAHYALAREITILLPQFLAQSYGLHNFNPATTPVTKENASLLLIQSFSVFALISALAFLILIPANVMLTRVQASLLSENEQTIVPFDRTFGGKVVSEEEGGKGVVGMLDSWRSFDWNGRVRLLKAYAKVVVMEVALVAAFFGTLTVEMWMLIGEDMKRFVPGQEGKTVL